MTLYHSSIKWFETSFRKPIPKGLPSSYIQLQILSDLFVAHLDEAANAEKKQEFIVLLNPNQIFEKTSECLAINQYMTYYQAQ